MTKVDPRESDPQFPDRPTHPDFIRLSEVVQHNDELVDTGQTTPEKIHGVDHDSLVYFMLHRIGIAMQSIDLTSQAGLIALYADAFTMGVKYAETKRKEE